MKLDPSEEPEFDRLRAEQTPEDIQVVNSIEEYGRVKGKREMLRNMLAKKFGELPQVTIDRLYGQSAERLEEIALSLMDAATLKDLGLTDE